MRRILSCVAPTTRLDLAGQSNIIGGSGKTSLEGILRRNSKPPEAENQKRSEVDWLDARALILLGVQNNHEVATRS